MAAVSAEIFPGSNVLVRGPLPRGNYLLTGPSGVGKTVFCKSFIAKGLEAGEAGIYLSTDEGCDKVRSTIKALMTASNADLRFIDAYSWRLGGPTGQREFITVNPSNLSEVSIACDSVCQGLSQPRFVFDSISSLALNFDPNTTLKFLQIVTAKMKKIGALAFFTLIPAAHDDKFLSTAKIMFDGTFEMRVDETGKEIARQMRVFSLKGAEHRTDWILYRIGERGISILKGELPRCDGCETPIQHEPLRAIVGGRHYTFHDLICEAKFKEKTKPKEDTTSKGSEPIIMEKEIEKRWLSLLGSEVQKAKLAADKGDLKEVLKHLRAMMDEKTFGTGFKDLWEEDFRYMKARYEQILTSPHLPRSVTDELARRLDGLLLNILHAS